jgi:hypothetical protein
MKRYPGLYSFRAEQKEVFCGRSTDIKELSKLIFIQRKVLLYSKSGIGKTSLLNAGVIPELSKNANFEFITIRFRAATKKSATPADVFFQAVKQHADFKNIDDKNTIIDSFIPNFKNEYWSVFKKNQLLGNKHKTYILIFDQFEELFTYPQNQLDEFKNRFSEIINTNALPYFFEEFENQIFENKDKIPDADRDLIYNPLNIKAVFSVRSDRLSQLNLLADKIPEIQKVFYELKPLSVNQAKQAIVEPANKEGDFDSKKFTFTETAITKIITFLTNNDTQNVESTQLQIVCQRIEENDDADGIVNDFDVPDFKDIFTDFYQSAISKVPKAEQAKARLLVEEELIRSRQRISLDRRLCTEFVSENTLKLLVEAYLIRAERNSVGDISYELSHDSLIGPISEVTEKRKREEDLARAEAERREELRKASEKQLKQRKTIGIVIVIALMFLGIGIFGIVMWRTTQNLLDELDQKQKQEKSLKFKSYSSEAQAAQKTGDFVHAINLWNIVKAFAEDTITINAQIDSCKSLIGKSKSFENLIFQAQIKVGSENFEEALSLYKQAIDLEVADQRVKDKLKDLRKIIDEKAIDNRKLESALEYNKALSAQYGSDAIKYENLSNRISILINKK